MKMCVCAFDVTHPLAVKDATYQADGRRDPKSSIQGVALYHPKFQQS